MWLRKEIFQRPRSLLNGSFKSKHRYPKNKGKKKILFFTPRIFFSNVPLSFFHPPILRFFSFLSSSPFPRFRSFSIFGSLTPTSLTLKAGLPFLRPLLLSPSLLRWRRAPRPPRTSPKAPTPSQHRRPRRARGPSGAARACRPPTPLAPAHRGRLPSASTCATAGFAGLRDALARATAG